MKKLVSVALATTCVLSLSACSGDNVVMNIVGPRPNAEVVRLVAEAEKDAALLEGTPLGELRSNQAAQLRDEVARLCGTLQDGSLPSTCDIEKKLAETPMTLELQDPASAAPAQLATLTEHFDALPEESRALVISQAIDALALSTTSPELPPPTTLENPEDITAAETMLQQEFAFQYALGSLTAFVSAESLNTIDNLREASQTRVARLTQLLPAEANTTRAPAYTFEPTHAPTDLASGETVLNELVSQLRNDWRAAATKASSAPWAQEATVLAANVQQK